MRDIGEFSEIYTGIFQIDLFRICVLTFIIEPASFVVDCRLHHDPITFGGRFGSNDVTAFQRGLHQGDDRCRKEFASLQRGACILAALRFDDFLEILIEEGDLETRILADRNRDIEVECLVDETDGFLELQPNAVATVRGSGQHDIVKRVEGPTAGNALIHRKAESVGADGNIFVSDFYNGRSVPELELVAAFRCLRSRPEQNGIGGAGDILVVEVGQGDGEFLKLSFYIYSANHTGGRGDGEHQRLSLGL